MGRSTSWADLPATQECEIDLFQLLIRVGEFVLPLFVFLTMFNVGLTQKPSDIAEYYQKWQFMLRMLLGNFVLSPLVMFLLLQLFSLPRDFAIGLLIFSLTAGAPFLIKLTQYSGHSLALGASLMLLLVSGTVIVLPLVLPLVLPDVEVNASAIALNLLRQLVWPIVLGMIVAWRLPALTDKLQPWVAKIGNIAMNILLVCNIVGYLPRMLSDFGAYVLAIIAGLLFIAAAFGIGWFLGGRSNRDDAQDVGALGTAQRNTAASMLVAAANFAQTPNVLVIITLTNAIGIQLMRLVARRLSADNHISLDSRESATQGGPA